MNTRTSLLGLAATSARAQTPDVDPLLDAVDAARFGPSPRPAAESAVMHGTFTLDIGSFTKDQPMKGTIDLLFDGPNIREIADYGTFGRVESGCNGDLVWEMHVAFGNTIQRGDGARALRRVFSFLRWPGWRATYTDGSIV